MITISVFSSAYLVRPLGALVMGHIGDKIGRRKALMLSIGLMTLTTLIIGLTPSHAIIGSFATCSIILARLIQGFAVSGEESGAAVYLSECAPPNRKGLMGSIIVASAQLGVMAGVFVCFSMSLVLSDEQIVAWGWRIPFLIALPFGYISYQLRKNDVNHRTDESIAICRYSSSYVSSTTYFYIFKYLCGDQRASFRHIGGLISSRSKVYRCIIYF